MEHCDRTLSPDDRPPSPHLFSLSPANLWRKVITACQIQDLFFWSVNATITQEPRYNNSWAETQLISVRICDSRSLDSKTQWSRRNRRNLDPLDFLRVGVCFSDHQTSTGSFFNQLSSFMSSVLKENSGGGTRCWVNKQAVNWLSSSIRCFNMNSYPWYSVYNYIKLSDQVREESVNWSRTSEGSRSDKGWLCSERG